MITETPNSMIIPLVRMEILNAASDPDRTESLITVFTRAYDRRMISRERKGRIEAVEIMQASMRRTDDDEISL
jgi:hypothetical protein